MDKVIFLDVDGVLNTFGNGGHFTVSKRRVKKLQNLVEATKALLVLSSTWRNHTYHLRRLKTKLAYRGMSLFSMTSNLEGFNISRGMEIQDWLDRHPNVSSYVILDDSSDMLEEQFPHFVNTDPYKGLTDEDVNRAIQILELEGGA